MMAGPERRGIMDIETKNVFAKFGAELEAFFANS